MTKAGTGEREAHNNSTHAKATPAACHRVHACVYAVVHHSWCSDMDKDEHNTQAQHKNGRAPLIIMEETRALHFSDQHA